MRRVAVSAVLIFLILVSCQPIRRYFATADARYHVLKGAQPWSYVGVYDGLNVELTLWTETAEYMTVYFRISNFAYGDAAYDLSQLSLECREGTYKITQIYDDGKSLPPTNVYHLKKGETADLTYFTRGDNPGMDQPDSVTVHLGEIVLDSGPKSISLGKVGFNLR